MPFKVVIREDSQSDSVNDCVHETHEFAGDCLTSPLTQAKQWLHENGFAYAESFRTPFNTVQKYESVRNPLFYATLEEM